ncbi:MAG: hypothetical protein K940chlam2_00081 [Chlamydiae bacterium]|nr:hypothetical protein [Chlamydiota bacterium]
MRRLFLFFFCSLALPLFSFGQNALSWDAVSDQPVPDWVKPVDFSEEIPSDEIWRQGAIVLLSNLQYHHQFQQQYVHVVVALHSRAYVDRFSLIEIPFEPAYEEVILHFVRIYRGGKTFDRLDDCQRIISLKNERSEILLYENKQSLSLAIDDVQRGDIIEYSYSVKGQPFYLQDRLSWRFINELGLCCKQIFRRLVTKTEVAIEMGESEGSISPSVQDIGGGYSEWIWEAKDVEAVEKEDHLPTWYDPSPMIQVSDGLQWEELAEALLPYYTFTDPVSEEIRELVSEWLQNYPFEEAALQAVRWVQSQVRYLSWHVWGDPWPALHPNEVFQRRYGDCKDKALLLITMLKLMGIESFPVLVDTNHRYKIAEYLPAKFSNHAIVGIELNGKAFFVDATHEGQGGSLDHLQIPPYGYGIALKEVGGGLITLPVSNDSFTIHLLWDFQIDVSQNRADLHYEKKCFGIAADSWRGYLRDVTLAGWLEDIERSYSRYYPKIDLIGSPELIDQFDSNELSVSLDCSLEGVVTQNEDSVSFSFKPFLVSRLLPSYLQSERGSPYKLDFPLTLQDSMTLNFDVDVAEEVGNKSFFYSGSCLALKFELLRTGDRQFVVNTYYQTFKDAIMVDELEEVIEQLKLFQEELAFSIDLASPCSP